MDEKITATKRVFDGHLVKLDVHQIELPDGKQSVREVIQHPGAVAMVALDDQQQVVLVKQFRIAAKKVMIEVPAGTLDPGEDPATCAERELQEETGYKPGSLEALGGYFVAPGYTTEYIHVFLAQQLVQSTLPADDDEFIEVLRVPLVEALAMIESGEIHDSKTILSLLRVARRLGV